MNARQPSFFAYFCSEKLGQSSRSVISIIIYPIPSDLGSQDDSSQASSTVGDHVRSLGTERFASLSCSRIPFFLSFFALAHSYLHVACFFLFVQSEKSNWISVAASSTTLVPFNPPHPPPPTPPLPLYRYSVVRAPQDPPLNQLLATF